MLSGAENSRVEAAVRLAEVATAGEIVVVLSRQAASYRSVPLVYGLLCALLTPWPLICLTNLPAARIFAAQLVAALLGTLGASVRPLLLVPYSVKRARAREAAAREFANRGLADTRGRTGVLLFLAVAERYAEVKGDVAIAGRVNEAEWREVIDALLPEVAAGRMAEGLVAAVGRIGAILSHAVPPDSRDADELPNRVVVL